MLSNRTDRLLPGLLTLFAMLYLTIPAPLNATPDTTPAEGQRIVLVTGSTGGLGREVARALARDGDFVIVHGRNVDRGRALIEEIRTDGRGSAAFYRADFARFNDVREFAAAIMADFERLDVLINNAGVFFPGSERRLSEDGYEMHFQVNYLSGYLLTTALLPLLEASAPSRIVNVSSGAQSPPDFNDIDMEDDYDGMRAYGQSKLAQIMMTYAMTDDLQARGITINALHPSSYMNTDMVTEAGIEPRSSVETGRDAVLRLINEDVGTGKFFSVFEEAGSHPASYDEEIVDRMMIVSEALTGE